MSKAVYALTQLQLGQAKWSHAPQRKTPRLPLHLIYKIIDHRVNDDFEYSHFSVRSCYFWHEWVNNAQNIGQAYPFLYTHILKTILSKLKASRTSFEEWIQRFDKRFCFLTVQQAEWYTARLLTLKAQVVYIEDGLCEMARRLGWTDEGT